MTTYILLLRGINVGGHKSIKMSELKLSLNKLGFTNTISYIQSGNLIFQYKKTENHLLSEMISKNILEVFGHDVPALVLQWGELVELIENNPFAKDPAIDPSSLYLTLLSTIPDQDKLELLLATQSAPDEIRALKQTIYLYCPKGYGNTKFSNTFIESKLKTSASTRNWKTMNQLLKLANENR